MKLWPGPQRPAAWRRLGVCVAAVVLLGGITPALAAAAGAAATASASVIERSSIGLPPSALDLYLSQHGGPAGPRTGALLIRLVGGIGDEPLTIQLPQAGPADGTQELVGGTTILGHGLAMAIMASTSSSSEEQAREDKPIAITIAFN